MLLVSEEKRTKEILSTTHQLTKTTSSTSESTEVWPLQGPREANPPKQASNFHFLFEVRGLNPNFSKDSTKEPFVQTLCIHSLAVWRGFKRWFSVLQKRLILFLQLSEQGGCCKQASSCFSNNKMPALLSHPFFCSRWKYIFFISDKNLSLSGMKKKHVENQDSQGKLKILPLISSSPRNSQLLPFKTQAC